MTDVTDWLPDVFIAGAPKAGTSSLHAWIADHPDALGSREKETYFFVDPGTHMHRPAAHAARGLDAYRAQFVLPPGPRPRVILESTPSYLYSRTALDMIPDLPTRPRCLFVLREPAAQIRSLYRYFRNNWDWIPAEMAFADYLAAVRAGTHGFGGNELAANALANARYVDHLRRWRDRLGGERMRVYGFDRLRTDPRGLTRDIAAWLGLDPGFYEAYAFPRENETYVPRNRALQRLNVAVRGRLPRGPVYRGLRKIYRRLNTTVDEPADTDEPREAALMAGLRAEFADANAALAREFGVEFEPCRAARGTEAAHGAG